MKSSYLLKPLVTAWMALSGAPFLSQAAPPAASALHLNGKLAQAGAPATGEHEFQFQLFTSETGNTVAPKTQTIVSTENIVAGNWQTAVDLRRFGGEKSILDDTIMPPGAALSILDDTIIPSVGDRSILDDTIRTSLQQNWRSVEGNWLQISVRRKGSTTFVPLSPRQRLGSVPRASTAFSAEHAVVAGSVADGAVDNRAIKAGAISGDKLAISSINREALADSSVSDSKIAPQTVVRSINGLRDDVTIAAGQGVTLTGQGSSLVISATGGGPSALPNDNTLGGGSLNTFNEGASFGFIGGGRLNMISNNIHSDVIAGGLENIIFSGSLSTIGGGWGNHVTGGWATIAGGSANMALGDGSTVAGGQGNEAKAWISTVTGGSGNVIDGAGAASIGGGRNNKLAGNSADGVIAGGFSNSISNAPAGVISGGYGNVLSSGAQGAVISGGTGNVADAFAATIIGGDNNSIKGTGAYGHSTVLGGLENKIDGGLSLAAGYRATVNHHGAFVWNGWPAAGTPFGSTRDSEFAARAIGGFRFVTEGTDIGFGDIRLDAGNAALLASGKNAQLNFSASFNLTAGEGVNFNTGGKGLFVDGQRVGAGGGGGQAGAGPIVVSTSGGFDLPQIRATQLNTQDFARLRLETGPQAWDMAAGPDGSLRFFGGGTDRLILNSDGVQITTGAAGLSVNGRKVAYADQLTQGGAQGGNGGALSATVAQAVAVSAVSEDQQAGVGVSAAGRVGVRATSANPQGAAVQAIQLNGSGYAGDFAGKLKVSSTLEANGGIRLSGALKVPSAGDNTPTTAFRLVPEQLQTVSAQQPGSFPSLYAVINHPMLNDHPDALLMLTPVNASACKLLQRNSDVMRGDFLRYYSDTNDNPASFRGRWVIDITPVPAGLGQPSTAQFSVFNALIVAP